MKGELCGLVDDILALQTTGYLISYKKKLGVN